MGQVGGNVRSAEETRERPGKERRAAAGAFEGTRETERLGGAANFSALRKFLRAGLTIGAAQLGERENERRSDETPRERCFFFSF